MFRYLPFLIAAVALMIVGAAGVSADPNTFYYQGYFEAQANVVPMQGWVYRAEPDTFQNSFYYRYRTAPLPRYDREEPPCGISNIRPGTVTLFSRAPLPGAYWYEDPDMFQAGTTVNLGYLTGRTH